MELRKLRGAVAAVVVFLMAALAPASAQTSKPQAWTSNRNGATEFPSQHAALAAVRAAGYPADKVTKVTQSSTSTSFVYSAAPQEPNLSDWYNYRGFGLAGAYASEEAALAQVRANFDAASDGCASATVYPTSEWVTEHLWSSNYADQQKRYYGGTREYRLSNGECVQSATWGTLYRDRNIACPAGTVWNNLAGTPDYQTCVIRDVATITGSPLPCSECDLRHNPINVSTGDKYQREQDFSLPWLSFSRYYHSSHSVPGTGVGPGWTHDLNITAYIGGSDSAVVLPDGGVLPFKYTGSAYTYEAIDGSGWRLRQVGTLYQLEKPDQTIKFDANRRASIIEDLSGQTIQLQYNTQGRLISATHSSGRSIMLEYGAGTPVSERVTAIKADGVVLVAYEYDSVGRLEYARYPDGSARRYHYENVAYPNLLTGVSDENNTRYATFGYDSNGWATSSEHAGGLYRGTFEYRADGSTAYADANGRVQVFNFTTTGVYRKIIGVTDSAGVTSTTYATPSSDFRRRPLSRLDKRGVQTTYSYADITDPVLGSVRQTTTNEAVGTPQARTTQTWRDVMTGRLRKTLLPGSETVYQLNTRGQPVSLTATDTASGATRTHATAYCEQVDINAGTCPLLGLVTSVNGPRTEVSDITTYTYYPSDDATCASAPTTCPHRKGDLWMVQDALGNITETLKYDGAGRVLSVKDANGVVTDFEYHPRGWLAARKVRGTDSASEADDQITRIDYYPTGLVQKTTLPDGSFTSYTYDAAHRLTDITDGEGNKLHYTLDNAGNRTKEETLGTTGSVLRTLSRVYNQLGQLQTHKDAYEHGTGYVYDANGNTDTVTDAHNRVTDNDYDPLNRLTKTIQNVGGLNVTTQFKYDAQDNLTEVIDPKNLSTKYRYNGLGDLLELDSPDTGITGYTYDSAGNRKTQTDARNVTATYGYDALNRLVSVSYPDSSLNVGYSYDTAATACVTGETFAAGRLSLITDGSGSTQHCYDRFGQMVRKVQTTAGQSLTVRYGYTRAGQLSSVTYPDGTVADYVRDSLGRTTQVGVTRPGGSRQILLTSASYYPFGPASEWVFGNGRLFQRTLNQNYQPGVIQDQSSGGLSLGYEFDPVGNLVKLRNGNQSEPPLRRYVYDALNRLAETRDGTTDALLQGYGYDATGNRTSATDGGVSTAYTLATNSHRLTDVGGVARTYDGAGNATAIGGTVREFVYSDANRMSAVKQGGVTAMSYAYNGKGEQVRRSNGATSTLTVYDEAGHWLGEYDGAGNPTQQVVWLDDLPVGLLVGPVTADQPLHYIEADALGTPRAVIDAQRNVTVWDWSLTGEVFGNDAPNGDADGDGTGLTFALRFPGQRYDAATQLNYNYFRDYDTSVGRYVESDPIGLRGGISTFGYVEGNPLISSDPFGLETPGPHSFPPGSTRDRLSRPSAEQVLSYYHGELDRVNIAGPSDQVFHCIAACRAKKSSRNSVDQIRSLLNLKEETDFLRWKVGAGYGEGKTRAQMLQDNEVDKRVNETGLQCPPNVPCAKQCKQYIDALRPGSRALMYKYLNSPANSVYPD